MFICHVGVHKFDTRFKHKFSRINLISNATQAIGLKTFNDIPEYKKAPTAAIIKKRVRIYFLEKCLYLIPNYKLIRRNVCIISMSLYFLVAICFNFIFLFN